MSHYHILFKLINVSKNDVKCFDQVFENGGVIDFYATSGGRRSICYTFTYYCTCVVIY